MSDEHTDCVNKLIVIGKRLDFEALGILKGKMQDLCRPDCVWYYKGKGSKELRKIAQGDKYRYLPFIAFEVAFSENEKNLRGSMLSLQLANAAASVIVLLGNPDRLKNLKPKLKKLFGRYSYIRYRIWTKRDVDTLYSKVIKKYPKSS